VSSGSTAEGYEPRVIETDNMSGVDVAALLRRSRHRAGLSQRELAARAHTSAAAVCLYERGQRAPRVDTLARLLAAMGATLELDAASAPSTIDVEANARTLKDLLDLADHLPRRSSRQMRYPVFRDLTS
jgi:transcriptional regulator with XRE-family HTH domain